MRKNSKSFIKETQALWQEQYHSPLLEEDVRTISTNVTDFFRLLAEWDSEDQQKKKEEVNNAE